MILKRYKFILSCTFVCVLRKWTNAWFYNITDTAKMVQQLKIQGEILSDEVAETMSKVDRKHYACSDPYNEYTPSIGHFEVISSPGYTAMILEELKNHLKHGSRGLDIGCGSGCVTACMALMLGKPGFMVGIDHKPGLVQQAHKNVMADNPKLINTGKIRFVAGDGRKGVPHLGPYDVIHVDGLLSSVPQVLLDQLKNGGRMIIPIGFWEEKQNLTVVDKDMVGNVSTRVLQDFYFLELKDLKDEGPSTESSDVVEDYLEQYNAKNPRDVDYYNES